MGYVRTRLVPGETKLLRTTSACSATTLQTQTTPNSDIIRSTKSVRNWLTESNYRTLGRPVSRPRLDGGAAANCATAIHRASPPSSR
jgi:hypothetical protein